MRKFFGFATAAALALSIAGCGDKGGGSSGGASGGGTVVTGGSAATGGGPAGTWVIDSSGLKEALRPKMAEQLEKSKAEFDKMPADQRAMAEKMMPSLDKMLDMAFEQMGKMQMELTLDANGSASFLADKGADKETGKGTWKLEGEKVVITPTEKNGKPVTEEDKKDAPPLLFKNGKLIMEADGLSIPFKRK